MLEEIKQLVARYKDRIDREIRERIPLLGPQTPLREACAYALLNGGKRFRPALVWMIAEALGNSAIADAALSVEYFHASSLIADDLPCMDNEDMRRNQPATHKQFGESTALLASYGLIAAGYGYLAKNAELIGKSALPFADRSDEICRLALENATYNTGLLGATGGQYADIFPGTLSVDSYSEIILRKTGSLFELSFVLGWLYGGGAIEQLPRVKKMGIHLGTAFQIADDIDDAEEDAAAGRKANMVALAGNRAACAMLETEKGLFLAELKTLGLEAILKA